MGLLGARRQGSWRRQLFPGDRVLPPSDRLQPGDVDRAARRNPGAYSAQLCQVLGRVAVVPAGRTEDQRVCVAEAVRGMEPAPPIEAERTAHPIGGHFGRRRRAARHELHPATFLAATLGPDRPGRSLEISPILPLLAAA